MYSAHVAAFDLHPLPSLLRTQPVTYVLHYEFVNDVRYPLEAGYVIVLSDAVSQLLA